MATEISDAKVEEAIARANSAKTVTKRREGTPPNLCLDGCGQRVWNRFVPGHDGKLRGQLLRDMRSGNKKIATEAAKRLIELGWDDLLPAKPVQVTAAKASEAA